MRTGGQEDSEDRRTVRTGGQEERKRGIQEDRRTGGQEQRRVGRHLCEEAW